MATYNSFIYIWFNSKERRFYIGKHFGHVSDGYICSSKEMLIHYRKNPNYFKRRILEYVQDMDGNQLMQAELKWLSFISENELGKKYYNQKNSNFGNTRGCKKSYVWNQGLTKQECEEYKLIRKNKLFCLLTEKPKRGVLFKPINSYCCPLCSKEFFSKKIRKFCSVKCTAKYYWSLNKGKSMPKRSKPAWNKGIPNPNGAINGKKSAEKVSKKALGRKIRIREDGTRYWTYPEKSML